MMQRIVGKEFPDPLDPSRSRDFSCWEAPGALGEVRGRDRSGGSAMRLEPPWLR